MKQLLLMLLIEGNAQFQLEIRKNKETFTDLGRLAGPVSRACDL